jgi:hypothetical protein
MGHDPLFDVLLMLAWLWLGLLVVIADGGGLNKPDASPRPASWRQRRLYWP